MGGVKYIVAGRFIDGTGAPVQRNIVLKVKGGIIVEIGSADGLSRHDGMVIEDLSHGTVLPALIDCNVSLLRSSAVEIVEQVSSGVDAAKIVARHIDDCLAHGVQGVVDNTDVSHLVEEYGRKRIDIRSSGEDFLKITYSSTIGAEDAPSPQLSNDDLRHIITGAGGKKVVVVANGRQPVAEALAAGCDAIEQGYDMGETNLRAMAARNVMWIPSVLRAKNGVDGASSGGSVCCRFSLRYVAPGKPIAGAEQFWRKVLDEQLQQLSLARELEITTALGTGAGNVGLLHGESMVEEMKLFIKAGYCLEEAIKCGSENGARFFDMSRLGVLAVGRPATFLVTRGTVKQLPRKLAYLEALYVDGQSSRTSS